MKTNKYMICDTNEGYYDLYLFEEEIDIAELEQVIRNHKESCIDENRQAFWDYESIEKEIKKHYKVKDLILLAKGENAKEIEDI